MVIGKQYISMLALACEVVSFIYIFIYLLQLHFAGAATYTTKQYIAHYKFLL